MPAARESTVTAELSENHRAVVEQRLLLHNVTWEVYKAIGDALPERPALRVTYDRGNLEIMTTSSPPAPLVWTSDPQRLLLHEIDWPSYEMLLQALDGHHLRMTYDRGSLEIMTLSPEHEGIKNLLRRFIEVLAEEFGLPLKNLGSTTYRRQDAECGLEPDECYYIKNWQQVSGKKRIDLTVDPPPELAVEVDVTHSSLDRMSIYARLGVREVWRFDGEKLRAYCLGASRKYKERNYSMIFVGVPLLDLVRFLRRGDVEEDMSIVRAFRAWVSGHMARSRSASRKKTSRKKHKDS